MRNISNLRCDETLTTFQIPKEQTVDDTLEIISLARIMQKLYETKENIRLDGSTINESRQVYIAIQSFEESFYDSLATLEEKNNRTMVDRYTLDVLYSLSLHSSETIELSDSTIKLDRIRQGGKRGGRSTHPDKQPFQSDYRADRKKGDSRANCIELLKPIYQDVASSTLATWAKEADKEDNFVRKAGRHRNK